MRQWSDRPGSNVPDVIILDVSVVIRRSSRVEVVRVVLVGSFITLLRSKLPNNRNETRQYADTLRRLCSIFEKKN